MTHTDGGMSGAGVLSAKVLDLEAELRRLVTAAEGPGLTSEHWAPLGEYVAVDELRAGRHLDVYRQQPR